VNSQIENSEKPKQDKLPILLRPANKDDVGFIFNSWLKSFRGSAHAAPISNEIYYSEHHKVIERILQYYDVVIACNEQDPSQIYGFICAGNTDSIFTLHYVYIKHTFRRMGIANALLNSFEHSEEYAAIYTHNSKSAAHLAKKYNFIYHPYVAMDPAAYQPKKIKASHPDSDQE
jgi:ribosomal protein S18 acetylase RimI-like enzyme